MQKRSIVIIAILVSLSFIGGMTANNIQRKDLALSSEKYTSGGSQVADGSGSLNIDLRPAETLYTVLRHLREFYVEPIKTGEESKMARGAVKSMLSSLNDPNSRFLEPEERRLIADSQNAVFHGIGAMTTLKRIKADGLEEEHLIVLSTFPDSPAMSAGIEPGDDIIAVDGRSVLPFNPYAKAGQMVDKARKDKKDTNTIRKELEVEQSRIDKGIPIVEAQGMLSGYDEKAIELTVKKPGSDKAVKVSVKPAKLYVEPVQYSIGEDSKLAVIKLNVLVDVTPKALEKALSDAASAGAKGLVLDLRGITGGSRASAQAIAGHFASGKKIGTLKMSRNRFEAIRADVFPAEQVWNKPAVVLVDEGTGRFAELIAQALKSQKGYKLVGQKTSGDTVYSTMVDLVDGSAYIMTTGRLTPTSGIDYTNKGVAVDVVSAKSKDKDAQLAQALKTLLQTVSGS